MSDIQSPPSTTVVFCVESGVFEAQTILAVESLRHFGGRFSNVPVLAITPRLGPSLTRDTLRRFDELGVTYIRRNLSHPRSWYCYMNKALAVMLAEEHATTEQIIWLDSDILVAAEPELFWLEPDVDCAISATDKNVGTTGPSDKNEPYWLALSESYGVNIDQLPWIVTEFDRQRVRFRLHSGVYAFRRSSGLGTGFVKACEQMLDSRIAYTDRLPFPGDDVALAFEIVLRNLRWRLLPLSYNYEMEPNSQMYRRDQLSSARIIHYHYAMTMPSACDWALTEIKSERPDLYNWLQERVPLNSKIGRLHRSLLRRFLKEWRDRQQNSFQATCRSTVMSES